MSFLRTHIILSSLHFHGKIAIANFNSPDDGSEGLEEDLPQPQRWQRYHQRGLKLEKRVKHLASLAPLPTQDRLSYTLLHLLTQGVNKQVCTMTMNCFYAFYADGLCSNFFEGLVLDINLSN